MTQTEIQPVGEPSGQAIGTVTLMFASPAASPQMPWALAKTFAADVAMAFAPGSTSSSNAPPSAPESAAFCA